MKFIAILLSFLLTTTSVAADDSHRKLAIEYLTLTKMEDILNASIKEYDDDQLFKNAPQEERKEFQTMLENSLGWDATKSQLTDLVVNLYTKEELKAYIAFIKTPVGKSYNDKNPEFSKRYTTLVSANFQRALKECCSQKK
jgi:hypothetical protein